MEYALPEVTIGVKWECVWNGIILNIFSKKTGIYTLFYFLY